eukprot:TRINITY_DN25885_c0_g1_i1.p1 TRINITY_DN25885_c0_g1~~TRINITY_DN25885_c0_g1_i1.p1  ORF type:complete len:299 (+),score=103.04 TRINITY_DN25885_c0_g1_i1:46-897(+)
MASPTAFTGQHAEYLRRHDVARMMELFLAELLKERPACAVTFAAKFFKESAAVPRAPAVAAAEERRSWAVHLTLTRRDVPPAALQTLAEFHAEQWGCLRRFFGTVEVPPEEARATGQSLAPRPWRNIVYAVYSTAPKLRDVPAAGLAEAIRGLGDPDVEEHWLEYSVGAGRREVTGELLWVTGLDAAKVDGVDVEKLPGDWSAALPYLSSAKGFGFSRLYTKMERPRPDGGRADGGFVAVNLTSFDSVEDWRACADTEAFGRAHSLTSNIPRCPGIFRVKRYH